MSGGFFDYQDACLDDIAERIDPDEDYQTPETIGYRRAISKQCRMLRRALHAYDWYISGDTCEEKFLEEMKKLGIKPIMQRKNKRQNKQEGTNE